MILPYSGGFVIICVKILLHILGDVNAWGNIYLRIY